MRKAKVKGEIWKSCHLNILPILRLTSHRLLKTVTIPSNELLITFAFMKQKILITHPIKVKYFPKQIDGIDIEVLENREDRYGQTLRRIHEYDGLVCIAISIDTRMLDRAVKLKVISAYGVGYDNIDVSAAKRAGVAVANTPNSTTIPTANMAIALMLSLMRKVAELNHKMKSRTLGEWYRRDSQGTTVENSTLGIIGMGRIGKAMATRARAFGMNIIYHNRNRLSEKDERVYVAEYYTLDDLLTKSDVVSIHTPLNDQSRSLIGEHELKLMKPTAFLINTGRGGVVDEDALIHCLENKKIAGAAFDVFENEPNPREEFLSLENMVVTPHCGTATQEARDGMMLEALGNVVAFLKGQEMTSRVA